MNSWDAFPGPKVVYTDPSARVAPLTKLRHDNGPGTFQIRTRIGRLQAAGGVPV